MGIKFKIRLYILAFLMMMGFAVLGSTAFRVQVNEHEMWAAKVPGEKEVTVRVPGVRGEIMDRNGMVMATNRASFEVTFNLKEIIDAYRVDLGPEDEMPMITYRAIEGSMQRTRTEPDVVRIVEETVLPEMVNLGLAKDYNANQMQIHYRGTQGVVPYSYQRDLSFEDFARYAENDFDLTGVELTVKPSRVYPYKALAPHIMGYVNLPDIQTVSDEERRTYDHYVADDYGGSGIEKGMDTYLRGKAGKRVLRKDAKGVIRGEIAYEPPRAGADVYLTLDAKVQYIAEQAIRAVGRGAVVVMDPRNGDILAMASVPSYDPNAFIPSIGQDDWDRYTKDKAAPMFNRALSQHPPGSTFKIPIALCGMLSNSHKHNFYCGGGVQYGDKFMKCWILSKGGGHGSLNLSEAIKRSCNCYFYQFGNHTGIDNINQVSELLGLGRPTGIPLEGEASGLVPSPKWLRLQGMNWSSAFTAMTSIGQGFAEATPLQMASVTSTVANGGKVYQPRLVKKVVEKDGTVLVPDEPVLKYDLTENGITAEGLELVKQGMWKVVNESGGTAGRARSETYAISGKTGTAQTGKPSEPTDAWFISFAPYDEPELAVCVYVHNGDSGGRAAAPIAGHIIKRVMVMKHGYELAVEPVEEAKGHFNRILLVSYSNDEDLDKYVEGDDADALVELPPGFAPVVTTDQYGYSGSSPSITPRADSRGSIGGLFQAKRLNEWKNRQPVQAKKPSQKKKPFGFLRRNR